MNAPGAPEGGPAKGRRGRPPKPEGTTRGDPFTIRLSDAERAAVKAAAEAAGVPESEWARRVLAATLQGATKPTT